MAKARFLTLSILLAFAGFGIAQAAMVPLAAGTYKLAIGSKAPCDLTVAADGSVTPGADCATGNPIAKVVASGSGYVLAFASGEAYGVIKPQGDTFTGKTADGSHKLVLTH